MCAILDANVVHEVFGANLPPAGEGFLSRINSGKLTLVVGGKLLEELERSSRKFKEWVKNALLYGRARLIDADQVAEQTAQVERDGAYTSDDPHILALAQVSGARLLYSNDERLKRDFGKKHLIDNPRGRVYSTRGAKPFTKNHKRLLADKDLCRTQR